VRKLVKCKIRRTDIGRPPVELQDVAQHQELLVEPDTKFAARNAIGFPLGPHKLDDILPVLNSVSHATCQYTDLTVASTMPKTMKRTGFPLLPVVTLG
jgi:hypothetical protein